MRYYLAGGAVRDMLLGRRPQEFDIVFEGTVDDFLRCYPGAVRVGKTTAVYIVNGHDHMPIAGSIHEDLLARDLTINALLLAEDGIIHTLPDTFADLKEGNLRHAAPHAFATDPVRVFRAARLQATLPGFRIVPETLDLMRKTTGLPSFQAIAAERVGREVMKALSGHTPGMFLRALSLAECLVPWFTPLEKARHIPAGPPQYHGSTSVFDHTCAVMDAIAAMPYVVSLSPEERSLAVWMGLCHDLGKTQTLPEALPRHIGHDTVGKDLALTFAATLRLPARWIKAAGLAASLHMKGGQYHHLRPGTRVDLLSQLVNTLLLPPFVGLIVADTGDESIACAIKRDMTAYRAVHLPVKWQNRGQDSAQKLRELRARAIAAGK